MAKWHIGDIEIPNQVVVAPMAGVTNAAFRVTAKEFGAGLVVCEMISDRGIMYHNKKTLGMMFVDPREHPVSIQIFGGSKETLLNAARFVDENTEADIIDINMGCPVPKVTKTDSGAYWLLDPDKIYEMVNAVSHAVSKPVTVKMRTGWDSDHIYAVDNALAAQAGGAKALAMHGRTRAQLYRGHADWNILAEVKKKLSIPFIGNGDVRSAQDAKRMLDEVGCDAVMIGRAALGNPWVLQQVERYLDDGVLIDEPTPREKISTAKLQLHRLVELKGENLAVREFRSQAAYYLKGIPRSAKTKAAVNSVDTEAEVDQIFDEFVDKLEKHPVRR